MRLEANAGSIGAARAFAASTLGGQDLGGLVEEAVLLASEVVTNAVVHGGPHRDGEEIELRVDVTLDAIRVEVRDPSPVPPVEREPGTGLSGRPMLMVDAVPARGA
ncbi:MAG: ATP-binding protein [Acidimicrobiia bacterium]